jgi:hypothetical protein
LAFFIRYFYVAQIHERHKNIIAVAASQLDIRSSVAHSLTTPTFGYAHSSGKRRFTERDETSTRSGAAAGWTMSYERPPTADGTTPQ